MSTKHVPFVKISKYYDDDIISLSEKSEILNHLHTCPLCNQEFDKLKKMIHMASCFCDIRITSENEFISNTLCRIHESAEKQLKVKSFIPRKSFLNARPVSAVAASIIGAVALTVYITTNVNNNSSHHFTMRNNAPGYTAAARNNTLSILQNNNVRLLEKSQSYIIGEVTPAELTNLTRQLSPSQVSIVAAGSRSVMPAATMSSTSGSDWQDVSYTNDVVDRTGTVIIKVRLYSE